MSCGYCIKYVNEALSELESIQNVIVMQGDVSLALLFLIKQGGIYVPLSYILYFLQNEMHGYNIIQKVKKMTNGDIIISPGTMYGSLSKMEKDGLIQFTKEEEKRKFYIITELGREILNIELKRIERLYKNSKGEHV